LLEEETKDAPQKEDSYEVIEEPRESFE
jgi:hypothetical protein